MKGIVFLDRDGTLIEEVGYLSDPERLKEIPGASRSLKRLSEAGYLLAVVSNQAGLAKGKFAESDLEAVHRAFVSRFLSQGVVFDDVAYCPHHPDGVVQPYRQACECRKPGTGMAERVMTRLKVPPSCAMWVVGDKMTDIRMGKRLGARTILVATGYGEEERREGERQGEHPDRFLPSINEAADCILSEGGKE
jgi:histidinol-phosphate phosphatase family protein